MIPPLVLSLIHYKKNTKAFKVLSLQLIFAFVSTMVAMILSNKHINNLPLLHIYTMVEFAFIAVYFYLVHDGFMRKGMLITLICLFVALGILNASLYTGWYRFNTLPRSVESFIVIALCISSYYRMLTQLKANRIYKDPVFWINTGFLIYFSGALFLFMMSNYILPLNHRLNILVWTIHALFSDLLYLFLFLGLWNIRRT
jgi:hypothetical protein